MEVMTGYKLLLVPDDSIEQTAVSRQAGEAYVAARHNLTERTIIGPFEVIADVGEDKQLRMSRLVYDTIEVVES